MKKKLLGCALIILAGLGKYFYDESCIEDEVQRRLKEAEAARKKDEDFERRRYERCL